MKCIILAAGYATRLYPKTKNFPKPLLKVGGSTILDRLVDDLAGTADIDEYIVVSNGRFAGHFEAWKLEKEKRISAGIRVINDGSQSNEERLGAVNDIWLAVKKTGTDHDFLVMAGDNVLDFSLSGFTEFAAHKGCSCVMCHEEYDLKKQRKTAVITFDDDGLITSYEEKPAEPRGHYAVPPFYYYKGRDIKRIPEALSGGCGYDAPGSFASWLSSKTSMYAYCMPGKRYDIGDLESYNYVQTLF